MSAVNYSNWARLNNKWTRYSILRSNDDHTSLLDNNNASENTILIIPGNPGNDGFYFDFATSILELWKKKSCQIFTIAHLNHVPLPSGMAKIDDSQLSERFNLDAQVHHALDFVREIVAPTMKDKKIHLIGHSIGAYIAAAIKGRLEREGLDVEIVGLFPTVVHMSETPAGRRIRPYVDFFAKHEKVTRALLWGLKWLPIELKRLLVRFFARQKLTPSVNQAAAELVDSLVFRNVTFMASNELNVVEDLDPKIREELSTGTVHLYYGTADHWVPLEYAYEMIQAIGSERVVFDDTGAEHAFVLKDSHKIAEKVVKLFLK